MPVITSPHNERIKLIRALNSQAKARRKAGQIVLEGVRLVGDALVTDASPEYVLFTEEARASNQPIATLLETLTRLGVSCFAVTPEVMAHASETETPQGIIAVLPMPDLALPTTCSMLLILDAVGDPGNMGTILRAAAAAGADGVILAPGCVDPYNPKALRSGMGAHFRIPIVSLPWPEIVTRCSGLGLIVYVADARARTLYTQVDWTRPSGLIIGSEAHGPGENARRLAHSHIAIPMTNGAESLNAAIAAAVILFESRRQRTQSA